MLHHTAFADEDNPDPWWTRLFRNLLDNEEFRHSYINRLSDHLNTIFQPYVVISHIDEIEQRIAPLMTEHIRRWCTQKSLDAGNRPIRSKRSWRNNVERMREFALHRGEHLRQHMAEFLELDGMADITLSVKSGRGKVRVNSVVLDNPDEWQGVYFSGVPVEVEAVPEAGFVFDAWEGGAPSEHIDSTSSVLEIDLTSNLSLRAHFKKAQSVSQISEKPKWP